MSTGEIAETDAGNNRLKELLQTEASTRAQESLRRTGEFLTALPNARGISERPHGVIHFNPLLSSYTPAHIEFAEDDANTYAFLEKGFSKDTNLTSDEMDRAREEVSVNGISLKMNKEEKTVRVFVPTSWDTFSDTPPGESVPRENRFVKTMLFVDLPLTEEAEKMLTGEKPLAGKNILVVGGAGSGLQVTPHIEKELLNLGVEPTMIFTPEAKAMIKGDRDRGEGKRLFNTERAEYLEELVDAGDEWIKGLESSDWKKGEHAHIKVAEMLREKNGAILFAPTTSNTIGFLGSGAVKGPLLLLSATIATGDVPYYVAPASEMSRDPRVQKQLLRVLNTEPWRARFIPDRQGVLAGGRIGQGRLAPADEIARTILHWDVFTKTMSSMQSGTESKSGTQSKVSNEAVLLRAGRKGGAIPVKPDEIFVHPVEEVAELGDD